ncbi:MAG: type V CRISPR-associated protein Cas12k [Crinalium sp.]
MLLTKPKSLPFPVAYETNEDLIWSRNSSCRLCVHFVGFKEHTFEIYCDQRQLKYFERFYQDQELKKASKDKYSAALFTLRSGRILWIQGTGKGEPWNINYLNLHCTLETRLWTEEGTKQISQEKASEIAQTLTNMKEKGELNDKQKAFIKRQDSTFERINNPFPRPSQPLYQGQSDIIVGVALGLEKPATVAVVDANTGKAIAYRSIQQLLGKKSPLLNRQRTQKRVLSHQRHEAQKNAAFNEFGESELGQYVDRLIAKAIISLAKTHKAGSIVLPKLGDMRELVQSEIQTRAELKIPGCTQAQQKYAKQYRIQVHQWGYGRLIDNIKAQAAKLGIVIEEEQQPIRNSPPEKALAMAISAFNSRYNS